MSIRLLLIISLILLLAATVQATVYVKSDSPGPGFDGNSWQTAYHTIQQAVMDAEASGEAVWVARGTYTEKVSITGPVEIYGGFAGTESSLAQRNRATSITTITLGGTGSVFTLSADAHIDGFTIDNCEYGIFVDACSPTIVNNTITRCNAFGVYCCFGSPSISDNSFTGNRFGVGCESGSATISHNVFTGNSEYAIYSLSGSASVSGNTMQSNYGGVYAGAGALTADGNSIRSNAACGLYTCEGATAAMVNNFLVANDDGIRTDATNASIINNTIVSSLRYGIYWHDGSPCIADNLVFANPTGLYKFGGSETLLRNDVYLNDLQYGDGISAAGDISVHPLFIDGATGDYHLTPGSPCINAGSNSVPDLPTFDVDGEGRAYGGKVDIGADEYWSPVLNPMEAKNAPEGAVIRANGGIVSAAFTDSLYVERQDRTSGIRVEKTAHGMPERARVNIAGRVRTDGDGERYIAADSLTTDGSTGDIRPLALSNASLGGSAAGLQSGVWNWRWNVYPGDAARYEWTQAVSLNNIGLLVTVWGRVTTVGDDYLYVDDGSHLDDGTLAGADKNIGVRVICDSSGYASGDYLIVTGISSCFQTPAGTVRRILSRGAGDVHRITEP